LFNNEKSLNNCPVIRKDYVDKAGEAIIYIRVSIGRKHKYINTGHKANPAKWDRVQ
jgi:hypothetical protein